VAEVRENLEGWLTCFGRPSSADLQMIHNAGRPLSGRIATFLLAILVATILGGIHGVQFSAHLAGAGEAISPAHAFVSQALPWYLWVLFIPLIERVPLHFPTGSGIGRVLGLNLVIGVAVAVVHLWVASALAALLVPDITTARPWYLLAAAPQQLSGFAGGLLTYALIVGLLYVGHFGRVLEQERVHSAELRAKIVEAELRSLRAQLCPHFLFNALNSTCALIASDPERAELMITRLSQLLRLALQTEGVSEVMLVKELDFACSYLEVEKIRFQDRLQVAIDVAPELRRALVPNFLLQPLVENAVHHAVEPSRTPRRLEVAASRRNGSLVIQVRDDGPGLSPGAMARRRGSIGLATTRARLEHLYGENFTLVVSDRPTGGAMAEVVMPYHVGHEAQFARDAS
jgi:two-component system LytT family sensor kinase